MPETTNIVPDVIEALKAALASAVVGSTIATFCTAYDYRHADEERDAILGLHLPVPAVIVTAETGESTNTILRVSVTVRHDQEVSTLQVHNADTRLVTGALYDLGDLDVDVTETATLTLGILEQSFSQVGWERVGRAYQSKVMFSMAVKGPE